MAEDVFSGWGIRTLSSRERRYNPVGYHAGTAATHFHTYRLPEVFAGFRQQEWGVPVHYPVACHPQAWAAGAVPFMVQTLLGLEPDGFDHRLRVVDPVLPNLVNWLELHCLSVGGARVDLRFERAGGDRVQLRDLKTDGELEVQDPEKP